MRQDRYGNSLDVGDWVAWASRKGSSAFLRRGIVMTCPDAVVDHNITVMSDKDRVVRRWPTDFVKIYGVTNGPLPG